MKIDQIKAVTHKIEQGAWVDELPNLPGVAVKTRGTFNSDHSRLLNKLRSQHTPEQLLTDEVQDAIELRVLHETILIDWAGIEDATYDPGVALKILSDPDLAVFRRAVAYAGNVVAREGRASLERDTKN